MRSGICVVTEMQSVYLVAESIWHHLSVYHIYRISSARIFFSYHLYVCFVEVVFGQCVNTNSRTSRVVSRGEVLAHWRSPFTFSFSLLLLPSSELLCVAYIRIENRLNQEKQKIFIKTKIYTDSFVM